MSQTSDDAFYAREAQQAVRAHRRHYTRDESLLAPQLQTPEEALKQIEEDSKEIFGKREAPASTSQAKEQQQSDEAQ